MFIICIFCKALTKLISMIFFESLCKSLTKLISMIFFDSLPHSRIFFFLYAFLSIFFPNVLKILHLSFSILIALSNPPIEPTPQQVLFKTKITRIFFIFLTTQEINYKL